MGYETIHYYRHGDTNRCFSYTGYVPDGDALRTRITNLYVSYFGRYGEPGGVEGYVAGAPSNWGGRGLDAVFLENAIISGELQSIQANGRHTGLSTGSCPVGGCTDSRANNYNSNADFDDGSCTYDPPTATISLNKSSIINTGSQSATLTWSAGGLYDSVSVSNITGEGASGSRSVSPSSSTIYTITVSGPGGTRSSSVTLTVYQPVFSNISVSPNPIIAGQSTSLSWSVSGDASQASIDQGIGPVLFNSSTTISPVSTTTYTLSASGNGGSDADSVQIVVNQIPQIASIFPIEINYEDVLSSNVTYRYATSGVTIVAEYSFLDGSITNESYLLPGTSSDESGEAVVETFSPAIPWNDLGPTSMNFTLTANGGGGSNSIGPFNINVNIDQRPDSFNMPQSLEQPISQDPVVSPDQDEILSDPILINGIDIPVEITASRPIQVRFDDDDPTIEANWKPIRNI